MHRVHINTSPTYPTSPASPASPAPDKYIHALLRRRKSVFKYIPGFFGGGEVSYKYIIIGKYMYFSGTRQVFKYTSPEPEKPEQYLKTPSRPRRSILKDISYATEVII